MIEPPKNQDDYPDREIDCQEAMEPLFRAMMDAMFAAGWAPREARIALRALINADRAKDIANARTEAEIAIARAMTTAHRRHP